MGIRYAELTVPLIKTAQEQEAKIQALTQELEAIKALLAQYGSDLQACCFKSTENSKTNYNMSFAELGSVSVVELPILEQNVPNPFDQSTVIQFYIPQNVKSAQMQIADMNGKVLKMQKIEKTGFGTMTIEAGNLAAGTYTYSLVLDGKVFDSKRMVLTTR